MKHIVAILCLLQSIGGLTQVQIGNVIYEVEHENLVLNGSFEENYLVHLGTTAMHPYNWPILGRSPDYFHPDSYNSVPKNSFGYQFPEEGNAYIGIGVQVVESIIRTESIGGMFKSPLGTGDYLIEFYYSFSGENDRFAPSRFGAGFDYDSAVNYDLAGNLSFLNHAQTTIAYDTLNWRKVQLVMHATGGEQLLVLGCFESYQEMDVTVLSTEHSDELSAFYYYVDNVSVRRITDSLYISDNSIILFPNPSPNGQFSLAYNLAADTNVTFTLYDAAGREVAARILPGGVQHIEMSFPVLASGVYTWRVQDRNNGNSVMGRGKLVVNN
jgi:hypothetical protein